MTLDLSPALVAIRAALGRPITYRRGGQSITLHASRGQRVATPADAETSSLATLAPSWILRGSDLTHSGTLWTPQEGDEIDHPTARGTETYRVTLDPVTGRTWTPCDNAATFLRVHTTRTA